MEIQTTALGTSSNEVEELITVPVEEQLNGLPGLEHLRSKSVAQLSAIELVFERGTDELQARQLVSGRLAQITPSLPSWSTPPFMLPALSATSRIMKIGLTSDEISQIELSSVAYRKVRARLMRVPGVAQVAIWGQEPQQSHVQVDPAKMARHGISLETVKEATADALDAGLLRYADGAVVGTGGFVESGDKRLNIRHLQAIEEPEQLARVHVATRNGRIIRRPRRVIQTAPPLAGSAVINDGPGLMLVVQKFRGANTMEVTRSVERAIDEMRPGLPKIAIDTTIFRPATFIEQSIDNLTMARLIGVLLVVLIIVAFLFEWRTAFISLIAIPLSLIAAILVLDLFGITINVMVIAGLVVAIGVVVDDAIIDVENIVRRLRQTRAAGTSNSTFRIVLDTSVEVRSAITYATIINVVAVVPVLFLEELSGSFFQPLVIAYGLAVLISMRGHATSRGSRRRRRSRPSAHHNQPGRRCASHRAVDLNPRGREPAPIDFPIAHRSSKPCSLRPAPTMTRRTRRPSAAHRTSATTSQPTRSLQPAASASRTTTSTRRTSASSSTPSR